MEVLDLFTKELSDYNEEIIKIGKKPKVEDYNINQNDVETIKDLIAQNYVEGQNFKDNPNKIEQVFFCSSGR